MPLRDKINDDVKNAMRAFVGPAVTPQTAARHAIADWRSDSGSSRKR